MPDWIYRTISQPVLFRLPAPTARGLALGFMGRLARLPAGPLLIDFLGHMRPDPRLRRSLCGIDFPTAVGLGPHLDTEAVALPALARFGFGFLEVGPVTLEGTPSSRTVARRTDQQAIWFPDPLHSLSLDNLLPRLAEVSRLGVPILVRLGHTPGAPHEQQVREGQRLIRELSPHAHLLSLSALGQALTEGWPVETWTAYLESLLATARNGSSPRPVLLCVPLDADMERAIPLIDAARAAGVGGLLVEGSLQADPDGRLVGRPCFESARRRVRELRQRYGENMFLIGSGGVHEPEQALALQAAGADLVQVDTGLIYSGPGLPKRINEAFLHETTTTVSAPELPERTVEMTWFWTTLMGAGMLFGSLLALVIASTYVVLPYDEAFVGMSRQDLAAVNPRLLAFMAHDRVSLAGTMVAIGVMYVGLSLFGIRRGLHWAQLSVYVSAFTGFASFFLFLGFGYLDPFHAFVTAVLLQLLLLGVHSRMRVATPETAPLREDAAWRRGLWGQLLLIFHGFGLLGAGATISAIGVTQVFVHEDLEFMQTTAEALRAAHPRLVPLVAHDRGTFGGMLLASGWAFLLPALWGFRQGSAWLWWSFLVAGVPAYAAAIGVHFAVGYTDLMHLLPAFGGMSTLLAGLALARAYLCGNAPGGSARRAG